ncbi:MAG: major capsid protein [Aurantimonas coralicida]|nr:major capsid protein [Jiella sp. LLJ827]MCQ0989863.1 major capsid protein [Jiella sp. LLJ827]
MLNHSDLFTFTSLTTAINKDPNAPDDLGRWFKWHAQGISTLTAIEERDGVIGLVQSQPRGAAIGQAGHPPGEGSPGAALPALRLDPRHRGAVGPRLRQRQRQRQRQRDGDRVLANGKAWSCKKAHTVKAKAFCTKTTGASCCGSEPRKTSLSMRGGLATSIPTGARER